jgi:hypothetical protein
VNAKSERKDVNAREVNEGRERKSFRRVQVAGLEALVLTEVGNFPDRIHK